MIIKDQYVPIRKWSLQDRPRERLTSRGRKSLSDAELLALLIGSGTKNESAVSLSQKILSAVTYDLNELGKLTVKELTQFKGIGQAKAMSIVAALELGRRRQFSGTQEISQITSSQDAYHMLAAELSDLQGEEFWVILLNRNNRIILKKRISTGGVSGTVVDPKIIFKLALDHLASSLILFHNHPSGNLRPSQADQRLTEKIVSAGKFLDIKILDHLIVGENNYFSFADEGLL